MSSDTDLMETTKQEELEKPIEYLQREGYRPGVRIENRRDGVFFVLFVDHMEDEDEARMLSETVRFGLRDI